LKKSLASIIPLIFPTFLGLLSTLGMGVDLYAGTIEGKVTAYGVKDPRDTVIYIDKIEGQTFAPPAEPRVLNQLNKEFVPHVLPLLKGGSVNFVNGDSFLHNIHAYFERKTLFNFGMPLEGQQITRTFDQAGKVVVLCDVHQEMSAYIIVIETPYVDVSDEEGRYQIVDIPAGNYTLKTWHEKLEPASKAVTVPDQGVIEVNLELR